MSTYQFQMANDESHAVVLFEGKAVATIQNNPAYLGGGLNMAQDSSKHGMPLHKVGKEMWDQFYAWAEDRAAAHQPADQGAKECAERGSNAN
jgi:hypothetical protein